MSLKSDKKLEEKKYRQETGLFMLEGKKGILELLSSSYEIVRIYSSLEASADIETALSEYKTRTGHKPEVLIVAPHVLESSSTVRSNDAGIAVGKMRNLATIDEALTASLSSFVLVLDDINDPGNLGTIIRTADWFGITHIVASKNTVDLYNPKVLRSSMGSFTRISLVSCDIEDFLKTAYEQNIPSYAAVLDGEPIIETNFSQNGIIVMGSESHGLKPDVLPYIKKHITIPRYGGAESLNVAAATAIMLFSTKR
jgi:TrmH family RNA methyltransferase